MPYDPVAVGSLVASGAQVVTAIVALGLAWKANKVNISAAAMARDALFVERLLEVTMDATAAATESRLLYGQLFNSFATAEAKQIARTEWLQARERVSDILSGAEAILEELKPAVEIWRKLEDPANEDPHVIGDALAVRDLAVARAGRARYDQLCGDFVRALASAAQRSRTAPVQ